MRNEGFADKNVLLLRRVRYLIVQFCQYIYAQQWDSVHEYWKDLEQELAEIIPESGKSHVALYESRECVEKQNYLRLCDLLVYEIDDYLLRLLQGTDEAVRKSLAEEARKENEQALAVYHGEILNLINKQKEERRIEYSYIGTENVCISVKDVEGEGRFRLFSIANPWLESVNIANTVKKIFLDEIHILGFGGGHLVNELARRYPDAKIRVYLPNLDVFKAVICSVPLSGILSNERINLFHDPSCNGFFFALNMEKTDINFDAFIDRQELRASVGNAETAGARLLYYKSRLKKISGRERVLSSYALEENVGRKIYEYIKDPLIGDL